MTRAARPATGGRALFRLRADGSNPENWVTTGGCPLGIRFDRAGNLLVADAFRGLLRIAPDGAMTVLATEADGKPILYANSVDVADDGSLPTFVRPQAVAYGHVLAIDGTGRVLASLQDHGGAYRLTTGATEARDYIYVGSLVMPMLGRLPKAKTGL